MDLARVGWNSELISRLLWKGRKSILSPFPKGFVMINTEKHVIQLYKNDGDSKIDSAGSKPLSIKLG